MLHVHKSTELILGHLKVTTYDGCREFFLPTFYTPPLTPPQHSVEVVDLVKRVLPVVSAAVQSVTGGEGEDSSTYSDTKLLHYAIVETEHPYKPASVSHFKVRKRIVWVGKGRRCNMLRLTTFT